MRRGRLAIWALLTTLSAVIAMLLWGGGRGEAVPARIVTVSRGDVRSVAALTGRMAWQDESAVYTAAPGTVAEIYVEEGERVAAGQALLRLEAGAAERIAAAWAAQADPALPSLDVQALLDCTVVRSPDNGVVRQVLTQAHTPVAAGTPVAVMSSTAQAVVCTAAEKDAAQVRKGMRAELLLDGEAIGWAEVTEVGPVTADALTGRMACRIVLVPEQRLTLPAGAAVDVDVVLSEAKDVTVLPVEALTDRGTVWRVYEGICTEIPVEIVLSDEMQAWVRLPEGMQAAVGEFSEGQRVSEVEP